MKKHIITFLIGLILFGCGCGYIPFEIMNYDFLETYSKDDFDYATRDYYYEIEPGNNYNFKSYDARVNMIIDNEIDNIKVEVRYDETFFRLNLEERTEEDSDQNKKIYYSFDYRHNSKNRKRIYNLIKKSIKDKKIYDYEDALTPVVNIYVNQTNSDLVTVDGTYID